VKSVSQKKKGKRISRSLNMIIIKDCGFNIKREYPFEVVLKRVIVDGNKDITQLVKELAKMILREKVMMILISCLFNKKKPLE
jgi:hypothetical protein